MNRFCSKNIPTFPVVLFTVYIVFTRTTMVRILLKRIYEVPHENDGYRIFLDRLWPRGQKKEDAKFDEWRKDITPSKDLRQWFHENTDLHWEVFQGRYRMEILQNPDFIPFTREIETYPVVTFLTAAKDIEQSHLPILKEVIEEYIKTNNQK